MVSHSAGALAGGVFCGHPAEKLEMESQEASGASEKSPLKPDVELQDRELEHSVALSGFKPISF